MLSHFTFSYQNQTYTFDPNQALDISLPLRAGSENPNCYYAEIPHFETIRVGSFVGSVAEGGVVNYQKITLTPHGNGTHTECYGHISADKEATIQNCLQNFLLLAELISVEPQVIDNDRVIQLTELKNKIKYTSEALIIRTLPNEESKKTRQYSGTNPPYLSAEIGDFLVEKGIKHLLIDLPSVDREVDEGKLLMHRAFWQYPAQIRRDCTISELIFVPNNIEDGLYLLNLQVISLDTDASPSKPILYKIIN